MDLVESGLKRRRMRPNFFAIAIITVSSGITAYLLSVFGLIPVNPTYAATMGFFLGFLYVLYQLFYWKTINGRYEKMREKEDTVEVR